MVWPLPVGDLSYLVFLVMVWMLPGVYGRKPAVTLDFLVAKAKEIERELRSVALHVEKLTADRLALDALADEAGLLGALERALAPEPVPPAVPTSRIRALKPYKVTFHGRHGPEEYSGAPNSVNDVPTELVKQLKGRVEVVPLTVEILGRPLEPWMITDD